MRAVVVVVGVLASFAAHADTFQVGPTRGLKTLGDLPALAPGDVVELDGAATYPAHRFPEDEAGTAAARITVRGVRVDGRRPILSGGVNTIEAAGDHYVFEGLEITGGSSRCFYHHADDITLRDSWVRDCPAHGILGADADSGSLLLDYVEVSGCGAGDQRHQIYMATDDTRFPDAVFRMQFCYVHDGVGGNGVKSRAARNEIYYNWIEGSYYHELELIGADGQPEALVREDGDVVGNVLVKAGAHPQHFAVRIGGDGTGQSYGRYRFVNNTIVMAANSSAVFRLFDGIESLEAHNNVLYRAGGGAVNVIDDSEVTWLGGVTRLSGSRNWVTTATNDAPAEWTETRRGADPGFDSGYRPGTGSPLLNDANGAPAPSGSVVGHEIPDPLPLPLYLPPQRTAMAPGSALPRPMNGALDIGAFEGGGIIAEADGGVGGSPDARPAPDAPAVVRDAAAPRDGAVGTSDARAVDGGAARGEASGGCGCQTGDAGGGGLALLLLAAALRRRARPTARR